ncbi:MAG: sugar ABC transporter ATP-binding protein [Gammaproteobacteria bacterium]|nr:MAG: sugar ABC transporter ATP-binding protein [Gammaproteobacteria bacterium]
MPKIRLDNLAKRYGEVEVIHGLNLELEDNEFTVFVGPSGCGKSTTLRMIAGLESVSSGEIYIGDKPVSTLEPKERDLAMVFQDYALYPHMNVAKNMSFALRLERRPRAEIDARVKEVAAMLGLEPYLHRKPAELSGGQRQRVAMGRALTRDASTFLFDEPLSNLDAKLRGQMRAELALMSQRVRKNMIYVTHDQVEAMTLGHRIVVMQDGHIRQEGSPEALFKRPNSKFVAGFIGSPPMNFLDGTLQQAGDALEVQGEGFRIPLPGDIAARAEQHGSNEVIVGIRPSDLVDQTGGDVAKDVGMHLTTLVSEYIGSQSILLTRCGSREVTVEVQSDQRIPVGETRHFMPTPDGLHLFDRESELAI